MPSIRGASLFEAGLRFHVVNLGCKVNRVESDTIAARLRARGCMPVDEHDAQVTIVNTCTVTGEADKKARKAVRRALKASPCSIVIVTGCAVSVNPEAFTSLSPRVKAVHKAELLVEIAQSSEGALRMGAGFRTRVNIKVQDGCNRACTFCIVHVARGPASSVPVRQVIDEARAYLDSGVKELVLTGIDLGSYRSEGKDLAGLLSALAEESLDAAGQGQCPARIRASSLEPVSLTDDFISLLASSEGLICRHLHLPLQSGSTKVLKDMARPYSAEEYNALVTELRKRIPQLSLTTDIICGFPGETEEDFARTVELSKSCRFSKIHVFPYSKRQGTPAARYPCQIAPEIKESRAQVLRQLSDELRREDRLRRSGDVELALVEGAKALTESYHEIEVGSRYRDGDLVRVTLD